MKIIKITSIIFCILGIIFGFFLFVYSIFGPFYKIPFIKNFYFSNGAYQEFDFNIKKDETYDIILILNNNDNCSKELTDSILGGYIYYREIKPSLNAEFEIVKENNNIMYKGNIPREKGRIESKNYSAYSFGSFYFNKNNNYKLNFYLKNFKSEWDSCNPQIKVQLNYFSLENNIFYLLISVIILIFFNLSLGLILIFGAIFKK